MKLHARPFSIRRHGKNDALRTDLRDLHGPDSGTLARPIKNGAIAHPLAEPRHMLVVAVQDRNAICRQRLHQLILRARNTRDAIGKELQMHRRDIRDDRPIRLRDACASAAISPAWFIPISITATSCSASSRSSCSGRPKPLFRFPCDFSTRNFAPSTCATASLVVVFPADPVMPITRPPQLPPHRVRQLLQAVEHAAAIVVRHAQQLACLQSRRLQPSHADHRGNRAIRKRSLHIVVAIQPLAPHREEQLARRNRARVDRVTQRLGSRYGSRPPHESNRPPVPASASLQSPSKLSSRNEGRPQRHRQTAPSGRANICIFSCPLPAINTMSPGCAAPIAISIAACSICLNQCTSPSVSRTPTSASSMIAIGSSLRGLSLVSTTRSLPSAAARPIFGRFVLSRSPPHPNM